MQQPDEVAASIGENVRRLRHRSRLSIDALAVRADVSKGTIIQVEQRRANPSITTLCRLADALGVGVASLVASPRPQVRVRQRDQAATLWRSERGSEATFLIGTDPPEIVELWDWTLVAGDGFDGDAHPAGTVEVLTVLAGALTLTVDGERRLVAEGDSVVFDAFVPHRYGNEGEVTTRFMMTVLQPAEAGLGPPTTIAPASEALE